MTVNDIVVLDRDILVATGIRVNFYNSKFELGNDVYGDLARQTKEDVLLKHYYPDFEFGKDYSILDIQNQIFNLVVCENPGDPYTKEHVFDAVRDMVGQLKSNHVKDLHVPYVAVSDDSFIGVLVSALRDLDITVFLYGMPNNKQLSELELGNVFEIMQTGFPHLHYLSDAGNSAAITALPDGYSESHLIGLFSEFKGSAVSVSNVITRDIKRLDDFLLDADGVKSVMFSNVDTSAIESVGCMFAGCKSLETVEGLESFDTSCCIDFALMFADNTNLAALDVSNFDTSSGKDFTGFFEDCSSLKSLDLSGWDVSNAVSLAKMFKGCKSLEKLNLTGWCPAEGVDVSDMFDGCISLEQVDCDNAIIQQAFTSMVTKGSSEVDSMNIF